MTKIHRVLKNENLEIIARNYGFKNWKSIYEAPCNRELRALRPNPNFIKENDRIEIPSNPVEVAKEKLEKLKKIRAEYVALNNNILQEWNSQYKKTKDLGKTVDTVAKIALIFKDLGFMIKSGYKTLNLTGKELTIANQKLQKSAINFAYEPIRSATMEGINDSFKLLDEKPEVGTIMALGKTALHFVLFDMESPSFWAQKLSGVNIEKLNAKTVEEINKTQQKVLNGLDEKIRQTEAEINKQAYYFNSHSSHIR